jgi:hypothetical protein
MSPRSGESDIACRWTWTRADGASSSEAHQKPANLCIHCGTNFHRCGLWKEKDKKKSERKESSDRQSVEHVCLRGTFSVPTPTLEALLVALLQPRGTPAQIIVELVRNLSA